MEFACELVNILTMGFKYYDLVYNCAMTNKYDYLIVGAGLLLASLPRTNKKAIVFW